MRARVLITLVKAEKASAPPTFFEQCDTFRAITAPRSALSARLSEQGHELVLHVTTAPALLQTLIRRLRQSQGIIQVAAGQQSGISCSYKVNNWQTPHQREYTTAGRELNPHPVEPSRSEDRPPHRRSRCLIALPEPPFEGNSPGCAVQYQPDIISRTNERRSNSKWEETQSEETQWRPNTRPPAEPDYPS